MSVIKLRRNHNNNVLSGLCFFAMTVYVAPCNICVIHCHFQTNNGKAVKCKLHNVNYQFYVLIGLYLEGDYFIVCY